MYDNRIGRWHSLDPLAEKYYGWSPFNYVLNNPLRFIDVEGLAPGELFKTKNDAAKDWGAYYNGVSIIRNKEYGSSIYSVSTENGEVMYSYSEANIGSDRGVNPSTPPDGGTTEAIIHSHGSYYGPTDNDFSEKDKKTLKEKGVDGYVSTPNGSLKRYDVDTGNTSTVSTNMDSDPKDPSRKNKNNPQDTAEENKKKREEARKREGEQQLRGFMTENGRTTEFLNP